MKRQVLLPDDLKAKLPRLYAQEQDADPVVYAKFFTPWSYWTWYVTEGEDQGDDYLLFGYVIGHEREWGYFSLNELQSVVHPCGLYIERDIHFQPRNASAIRDIHTHYKQSNSPQEPAGNLATKQCRVCRQPYDSPHLTNCPQRRNPATPNGDPRILVKREDVDL
jgi:hypothetical protein